MKNELIDLIKYRLKKSSETLADAKIIFEKASLTSTVNRIYYAMFYAVNALLLSKNFSSAKHSEVRALFNKEFINKGLVDKELGKFYSKIFEERQEGDYKDFAKFDNETVKNWLNSAEDFINEIEKLTVNIIDKNL
ncbi:MAG: HEPN domain-containing protein [Actinobacteria bacterium]|nr:HEPN domain-containing protein [Actinomycetota bacterium]